MLEPRHRIAIYMEANLDSDYGKMGFGVMRFCRNEIVCIVDSTHAGKTVREASPLPYDHPVVAGIDEAAEMGAEVLVLGTAPSGGRIPESWIDPLTRAIRWGMSLVNGLHDPLNERLGHHLKPGQWIWDVRQPGFTPAIASGQAATLSNRRILMVGTDMSIGKMTAGLEIWKWMRDRRPGIRTDFLATGQIGITVTGTGIPLDAFKLDHACGAVETLVMGSAEADVVIVEGQGSLLHPGSSATLSLIRGACPTHLIMCHRAGMSTLRAPSNVKIPPLKAFIELNERVVSACGALAPAVTAGLALNTSELEEAAALEAIGALELETGYPVEDVVRFGAGKLASLLA